MNLVGKIFTVLIFVMSLVFASFCVMVYGAHVNWYDRAMNPASSVSAEKPLGLTHQLKEAKDKNTEVQNELTKTLEEKQRIQDSSRQKVTELETAKSQLETQLENQDQEVARLTQLERTANASLEAMGLSLNNLRGEVTLLRDTMRSTETKSDESFAEVVRLTDELHAKANEYKILVARAAKVTADVSAANDALRGLGVDPATVKTVGVVPTVEGKVLAVRSSNLIAISIGSDDGLAKGHELQVYRSAAGVNTYLGKVRVTEVSGNGAVCQILPQFRKGAIQVGDNVATRLSSGS